MKTKILLFLCALTVSTILSAATITVTNNLASGSGSLAAAVDLATAGDVINFNFTGTNEIMLSEMIEMKSITIDGLNNGSKVILKQSKVGTRIFNLKAGIDATMSNLIFDGQSDVLGITKQTFATVYGSTLNIDNCVFRNFLAQAGDNGGVGRVQGVLNVTNTLFQNNSCAGAYGGGALCIYNAANITIDKCSFIGNSSTGVALSGGGAIVARATTVFNTCNVKITNSTFANNLSSNTGGAILTTVQDGTGNFTVNLTAVNCTFTGNQGDGAISALTTIKGIANVYLVNSIVINNVDAAGSAYSDLLETKGTDANTVALIEPHNVIYSIASGNIVTSGRNCIQVSNPSTADIFKELETLWGTDKKLPVLSISNGQTVAMISTSSIAKNAGVATLAGYTIPTVDQLGETRPASPAIGAVEFKTFLSVPGLTLGDKINLTIKNREISVSGITKPTTLEIYSLMGSLLKKTLVSDNSSFTMQGFQGNIFIVKIENQSFKVFLQ